MSEMKAIDTVDVENFLAKFLPTAKNGSVYVTATWAQSLDGRISAAPGERTRLSGAYSKKMTHYLRSKHDAILVGHKTVKADNPRLNCRYTPARSGDAAKEAQYFSPRPIVLDSSLDWDISPSNWQQWAVLQGAAAGLSKAPWVVTCETAKVDPDKVRILEKCGGEVISVKDTRDWEGIQAALHARGIRSLMIEGGSEVLDTTLQSGTVDVVIITIAPVFLGRRGVDVAPSRALELAEPEWWNMAGVPDSVVAGRLD